MINNPFLTMTKEGLSEAQTIMTYARLGRIIRSVIPAPRSKGFAAFLYYLIEADTESWDGLWNDLAEAERQHAKAAEDSLATNG